MAGKQSGKNSGLQQRKGGVIQNHHTNTDVSRGIFNGGTTANPGESVNQSFTNGKVSKIKGSTVLSIKERQDCYHLVTLIRATQKNHFLFDSINLHKYFMSEKQKRSTISQKAKQTQKRPNNFFERLNQRVIL